MPVQPILAAHRSQLEQLRRRLVDTARNAITIRQSWRDEDATAFARTMADVVLGGQEQVGALTDAYLSRVAEEVLGVPRMPIGWDPAAGSGGFQQGQWLRGIDPFEVYQRPYRRIWHALSQNKPLAAAVGIGATTAAAMVAMDLKLAERSAVRQILGRDDRIVGYRRVPSGIRSCGLCLAASTQRYHKRELMPIHGGSCRCSVLPIYGERDPGRVINEQLLQKVYEASEGATDRPTLAKIRVHHHGEYGPVLTAAEHHFRGPAEVA